MEGIWDGAAIGSTAATRGTATAGEIAVLTMGGGMLKELAEIDESSAVVAFPLKTGLGRGFGRGAERTEVDVDVDIEVSADLGADCAVEMLDVVGRVVGKDEMSEAKERSFVKLGDWIDEAEHARKLFTPYSSFMEWRTHSPVVWVGMFAGLTIGGGIIAGRTSEKFGVCIVDTTYT